MNLQQPTEPQEEQILLTVADQSKLDLVMELLSHFDLVRAERVRIGAGIGTGSSNAVTTSPSFLDSYGMWEGRDVSAETLRQGWERNQPKNE